MAGLQVLEDQFGPKGFAVLGFYSDNFGKQGGSPEQIAQVTEKYGVRYDQFAVAPVVGDDARPVFRWLLNQEGAAAPQWNFHKYLLGRDGSLLSSFGTPSYPGRDPSESKWSDSEIVKAITTALG